VADEGCAERTVRGAFQHGTGAAASEKREERANFNGGALVPNRSSTGGGKASQSRARESSSSESALDFGADLVGNARERESEREREREKRRERAMSRNRTGQGRQANPVAVILPRVE